MQMGVWQVNTFLRAVPEMLPVGCRGTVGGSTPAPSSQIQHQLGFQGEVRRFCFLQRGPRAGECAGARGEGRGADLQGEARRRQGAVHSSTASHPECPLLWAMLNSTPGGTEWMWWSFRDSQRACEGIADPCFMSTPAPSLSLGDTHTEMPTPRDTLVAR